jgi:hypothetical protein
MRGMLPHDMVDAAMTTFPIARRALLGAGLAAGAALLLRAPALARTAVTVYKDPT